MACTLAESPSDPLHRKLRQLRCLRRRFDCYRVERTSSRAGIAPAEVQRLSRRTFSQTERNLNDIRNAVAAFTSVISTYFPSAGRAEESDFKLRSGSEENRGLMMVSAAGFEPATHALKASLGHSQQTTCTSSLLHARHSKTNEMRTRHRSGCREGASN